MYAMYNIIDKNHNVYHGTTVEELYEKNRIKNTNIIYVKSFILMQC